jgi:hypothetical protein
MTAPRVTQPASAVGAVPWRLALTAAFASAAVGCISDASPERPAPPVVDPASGVAVHIDSISALGHVTGWVEAVGEPLVIPGTLDRGFGNDGVVRVPVSGVSGMTSVDVGSSGRILVALTQREADAKKSSVAILAFDEHGAALPGAGSAVYPDVNLEAVQVVSLDDGKVLLLANVDGALSLVSRFHSDGTPDRSFADGGRVLGDRSEHLPGSALALAAHGDVLVGATSVTEHSNSAFVVLHLDSAGAVVEKANVSWSVPHVPLQEAGLRVVSSGKMLAVGTAQTDAGSGYALYRAFTDGEQDPSFNSAVFTDALRPFIGLSGVAADEQSDGRGVVVGSLHDHHSGDISLLVAGQLANGDTNLHFGLPPGSKPGLGALGFRHNLLNCTGVDVAVARDDKIIALGQGKSKQGLGVAFAVRLHSDGVEDHVFAYSERGVLSDPGKDVYAAGLALDVHGKLLIAGFAYKEDRATEVAEAVLLARYHTAGIRSLTLHYEDQDVDGLVHADGSFTAKIPGLGAGVVTAELDYDWGDARSSVSDSVRCELRDETLRCE